MDLLKEILKNKSILFRSMTMKILYKRQNCRYIDLLKSMKKVITLVV